MTNQRAFGEALFPARPKILGKRLQPFKVGHAILLQRLESPMIIGGVSTMGDLMLAVEICRRNYRGARLFLESPFLGVRLRLRGLVVAVRHRSTWKQHALNFGEYIGASLQGPEVWSEGNGGKTPGAPFLQYLRLMQMAYLGKTSEAAMETNFGEAIWDIAAFNELRDRLSIFSDDEREIERELTKCRN